jgi:hypothetical protein
VAATLCIGSHAHAASHAHAYVNRKLIGVDDEKKAAFVKIKGVFFLYLYYYLFCDTGKRKLPVASAMNQPNQLIACANGSAGLYTRSLERRPVLRYGEISNNE